MINPKVSVLMSVYNGGHFLKDTILSVLSQTYKDFEFVIVNDASTDNSLDIIKDFAQSDPRIKIITNEQNLGLTKSLNKGLRASFGEYIARLDAGDLSASDRLQKQVEFLDGNKDVGLVGSFMDIIDEQGTVIKKVVYPTLDNDLRKVLINYNPFVHSSIMFRKSVAEKSGFYDEYYFYAQDYDLYLRLLSHAKFANIPEFLVQYRHYSKSITFTKNKEQIKFANLARKRAIDNGLYSKMAYIYIIKNYLILLVPTKFKLFLKKLI